jgi:endo-1,3(4)-beta-glucanase
MTLTCRLQALSKFATIIWTLRELGLDSINADNGLVRLKAAFARFVDNRQRFPLVYETAWKGLVSTGSYATGDAGQDFGNTYYSKSDSRCRSPTRGLGYLMASR